MEMIRPKVLDVVADPIFYMGRDPVLTLLLVVVVVVIVVVAILLILRAKKKRK